MSAQVAYPDPMLADNEKTVAFLKEFVGEDEAKIKEIEEWGAKRQERIDRLCGFASLLERNDILKEGSKKEGKKLTGIMREAAIEQCLAIATRSGLVEMEYRFNDSQSGPLCARLNLDVQAVKTVPVKSPTGLFESPDDEARFLKAVKGKDVYELGRIARPLVIEQRYRIYG